MLMSGKNTCDFCRKLMPAVLEGIRCLVLLAFAWRSLYFARMLVMLGEGAYQTKKVNTACSWIISHE